MSKTQKTEPINKTRPIRAESSQYIAIGITAYFMFGWAIYINFTDKSGWSGLYTLPMLLVAAIMLVVNAIGLVVLAVKTRIHRRKWVYSVGGLVTLMPLILTFLYITIATQLEVGARARASSPITLQQALQLVDTCQVETIELGGGGAQMQLNAFTPVLPGMDARPERRVFDGKYFDELVQLARRKDVESRCGFIPTYDIRRPQQPPTKKWITQAEAETIISKCLWNTQFIPDTRYTTSPPVPGKDDSGIFLEQHLSVWNDDTESIITLVRVDDATRAALQQKVNACGGRY